ncbi:hypothetical protein [Caballeronia zhejiangensis]|jgi:hypothetical protein|uniref:hypothetical protein n=1 Tax=Caballeronia zhejiangensis TaxID=871203 RepID=UPI001FD3507A|nr:hypothetical protein [Caballeronia zhejiangensis]
MADLDAVPDEESAVPLVDDTTVKPKLKALSRIRRDLTDDELQSSGVQKLLIDKYEDSQELVQELKAYRDKFAEADKGLAVAEHKLQRNRAFEILSGTGLAVGAAMIGYAPNAWSSQPTGYMILGFGVVLTIGGIGAKVIDQ